MTRRWTKTLWVALVGITSACGGDEVDLLAAYPPVQLLSFSPSGRVEHTEPIELRFSVPVGPSDSAAWYSISPPLPVRQHWVNPQTVRLVPEAPLAPSTRYRVALNPAALRPHTRWLGPDHFTFFTPLFQVRSISGRFGAELDEAELWLSFNQPVDPAALASRVSASVEGVSVGIEPKPGQRVSRVHQLHLVRPPEVSPDAPVRVRVAAELRPASGGEPLDKVVVRTLDPAAIEPLEWLWMRPEWRGRPQLRLGFDGPVRAESVRSMLSIRPKLAWTARPEGSDLLVSGPFETGRSYTVALKPSLASVDGRTLDKDMEWAVSLTPPPASLRIAGDQGAILSGASLQVDAVGVEAVDVEVIKVYQENLAHILPELHTPPGMDLERLGKRAHLARVEVGQAARFEVPLSDPAPERPGLCKVVLVDADRPYVRASAWVQLGPLSLIAKLGPQYAWAQVRDPKGAPVSGAVVDLRSATNRLVARMKTNADGVAELHHRMASDDPVAFITAHGLGSFSLLPVLGTQLDSRPELRAGAVDPVGDYDAYVFVTRPWVRDGDTLEALVLLRGLGLSTPPAGQAYSLRLEDASGQEKTRLDGQVWREGGDLVQLPLPPGLHGAYALVAYVGGKEAGRTPIQVGASASLREPQGPPRAQAATATQTASVAQSMDFSLDQQRYPVDAVATARVEVPQAGTLRVTVERDRVYWQEVRRVIPGEVMVSVPIQAAWQPNAFVVAHLSPDRGPALQEALPIQIGAQDALQVQLSAPALVRSKRALPVNVSVQGHGPRAYVALFALSPSLLPAARVIDPHAYFARRRGWPLITYDGKAVAGAAAAAPAGPPPSVAAALGTLLPAERVVAVSRISRLPTNGQLSFALHLPEVQGPVELIAIAFSGRNFGVGRSQTELRDPVYLEAELPPQLRRGDAFSLPVTVHNGTDQPQQVSVRIQGGLGAGQEVLSVPPREHRRARFKLRAEAAGEQLIRVRAREAEWVGRVRVVERRSTRSAGAGTSAGFRQAGTLTVPAGVSAATARVRFLVGPTASYTLAAAQARLVMNPRDDVVAEATRLLARLQLPDLTRAGGRKPSGAWPPRPRALARDPARLEALIAPSGEVRAWPEGPTADLRSQALALHTLIEARRAGLKVDSGRLNHAVSALRAQITQESPFLDRAYAAFVLVRGGVGDTPLLTSLAARLPEGVSPAARAWLGAALLLRGLPSGKELLAAAQPDSDESLAEVLWAQVSAAPHHPRAGELGEQLVARAKRGQWTGLRANGVALMALSALEARAPRRKPYWGAIRYNGAPVRRFNSKAPVVLGDLRGQWLGRPISVNVTGAGVAHVGVVVEGRVEAAMSDGLSLGQRSSGLRAGQVGELQYTLQSPQAGRVVLTAPLPSGFVVESIEAEGGQLHRRFAGEDHLRATLSLPAGQAVVLKVRGKPGFSGRLLWPGAWASAWSGEGPRAQAAQTALTVD